MTMMADAEFWGDWSQNSDCLATTEPVAGLLVDCAAVVGVTADRSSVYPYFPVPAYRAYAKLGTYTVKPPSSPSTRARTPPPSGRLSPCRER